MQGSVPVSSSVGGKLHFDKATTTNPNESISMKLTLKRAAFYNVEVLYGGVIHQGIFGSPFSISVSPAATFPANCKSSYPPQITAAEDFEITVFPKDEHHNPTDHETVLFAFLRAPSNDDVLQNLGAMESTFAADTGDATFSLVKNFVASGTYMLYVRDSFGNDISKSPVSRVNLWAEHTNTPLS